MSHKGFNGKQARSVFIQMCAKSVSEGMAGKPALPAEPAFMGMDMVGEKESINGSVLSVLFWEEISHRSTAYKPIPGQKVKSGF